MDKKVGERVYDIRWHEFMSAGVGVRVPVGMCVGMCHCSVVEIMFSMSPSL